MKSLKFLSVLFLSALTFNSCSSDDDNPEAVNEEELITTVTAVFTPIGGGDVITLEYQDLDGDGAAEATTSVSGSFAQNTTYEGDVTFLNESTNPVEDITEEILEEGDDHQLFYQVTGTLNAITYDEGLVNYDSNGFPIGLQSVFTTTDAASGTITIVLRHQPSKDATGVADGDITNANGSTDASVSFAVTVE
ncbi:type 1 periplasmic binding fold superfamily protein [Lacinutrix undariae]